MKIIFRVQKKALNDLTFKHGFHTDVLQKHKHLKQFIFAAKSHKIRCF